jgi:hypothetical protein
VHLTKPLAMYAQTALGRMYGRPPDRRWPAATTASAGSATTTGCAATELWHGLSYITFSYTDLRVDQAGTVAGGTSESPSVAPWATAETATALKSSSSSLPIRTHPFPAHCAS